MIDKFYQNGQQVIVTDKKGKWKGVIYGNTNCDKGLSKQKAQAYRGACKTGWAYGKYVQEVQKGSISKKKNHVTKPKGKANVSLGRKLYKKCAGCHGGTGRGKPLGKHIRLAGQSASQIRSKLYAYKKGKRNRTGFGILMKGQAAGLSSTKINALAAYIATFR